MKPVVTGPCWICGQVRELTEEHLPPKSAFNNSETFLYTFEEAQLLMHGGGPRGKRVQGGFRVPRLCEQCNNNTGAWYGQAYVNFCKNAVPQLQRAVLSRDLRPELTLRTHPLRVAKQALAMFLACAGEQFSGRHPDLQRLVLNKRLNGCPPDVHMYCYANLGSIGRILPLVAFSHEKGRNYLATEVSAFPFGFVLFLDQPYAGRELVDVSHWLNEDYDCRREVILKLPMHRILSSMPIDFRSQLELAATREKNVMRQYQQPSEEERYEHRQRCKRMADKLNNRLGPSTSREFMLDSHIAMAIADRPGETAESLA